MASSHTNLNFVLFPLMAQGHQIPMVDIARLLAQRGVIVTIITTPVNAKRFKSIIDRAIEDNLRTQVVEVQFPFAEAGLPEGFENFDLLTSTSHMVNMYMFTAMKLLEKPAENVLLSSISATKLHHLRW